LVKSLNKKFTNPAQNAGFFNAQYMKKEKDRGIRLEPDLLVSVATGCLGTVRKKAEPRLASNSFTYEQFWRIFKLVAGASNGRNDGGFVFSTYYLNSKIRIGEQRYNDTISTLLDEFCSQFGYQSKIDNSRRQVIVFKPKK
jgi:hypothetical protein